MNNNQQQYYSHSVCESHNEPFTNMCINLKCLTPLCPDCITVHSKTHPDSQIVSIKECRHNCTQKLKCIAEHCQLLLKNPQIQAVRFMDQLIQESNSKLAIMKDKLIHKIDNYFHELNLQMRNEIFAISKNPLIIEFQSRLITIIEQVEQLNKQVNVADKQQIEAFRQAHTLDSNFLIAKTSQETHKILEDIKYPQIMVSSNFDDLFEKQIRQSLRIDLVEVHIKTLQGGKSDAKLPPSSTKKFPPTISMQDHFNEQCDHKYLHYFKYNSNELYLLNLQVAHFSTSSVFDKVILKQTIKIPVFHSSIITSEGNIYLLGGSIPNQNYPNQKSDVIYQYEWGKDYLKKVGQMIQGRSSFGCCHRDHYVYSIAGLTENANETRICERYDLRFKKSEPIADCLYTAVAATCTIINDYVYKISQSNIERYSMRTGTWETVDPTISVDGHIFRGLCQYSCAVPITQNDILFFGGYQNEVGKDFVYQIERACDQNPHIQHLDFTLPHKEGFWNGQGIVHSGYVYALQNVERIAGEISLDFRRVLRYNGQWEALN